LFHGFVAVAGTVMEGLAVGLVLGRVAGGVDGSVVCVVCGSVLDLT